MEHFLAFVCASVPRTTPIRLFNVILCSVMILNNQFPGGEREKVYVENGVLMKSNRFRCLKGTEFVSLVVNSTRLIRAKSLQGQMF